MVRPLYQLFFFCGPSVKAPVHRPWEFVFFPTVSTKAKRTVPRFIHGIAPAAPSPILTARPPIVNAWQTTNLEFSAVAADKR